MSKIPFFTRFLQLTYGSYLKYRYKIKVEGFERMPNEGPFLLLANHTHVLDPFMISVVSGHYVRWVAGAYLFKNQILRVLLRKWVGSIAKQQGRSDLETIKEIEGAFKNNEVVGLFPEGTRTWDGTSVGFDKTTAKLARLFNVPVVLLNMEGSFAVKPRWAKTTRKGPIIIRLVDVFSTEQLKKMKLSELYSHLSEKLHFDYPKWQKENKFEYIGNRKAEKVEQLLYLCPRCENGSTLNSKGSLLICSNCSLEVEFDNYDNLHFLNSSESYFSNLYEWHMWEKDEIQNNFIEFPFDKGLLLQKAVKDRLLTISKNFNFILEKDRIVVSFDKEFSSGMLKGFKEIYWDFANMESMIINAKSTVEFFHKSELWRIRIANNRSILKYVEYYEGQKESL
jgi:1-acyl-sn-glycerol-3-phosphate acyltransferase